MEIRHTTELEGTFCWVIGTFRTNYQSCRDQSHHTHTLFTDDTLIIGEDALSCTHSRQLFLPMFVHLDSVTYVLNIDQVSLDSLHAVVDLVSHPPVEKDDFTQLHGIAMRQILGHFTTYTWGLPSHYWWPLHQIPLSGHPLQLDRILWTVS